MSENKKRTRGKISKRVRERLSTLPYLLQVVLIFSLGTTLGGLSLWSVLH